MAVKEDHVATFDDVHPARPEQVWSIASDKEWASSLRVWSDDVSCGGVADVIQRRGEAVGAEEEEVDALVTTMQRRGFDEWAVAVVAVQDLYGFADKSDSILANLL